MPWWVARGERVGNVTVCNLVCYRNTMGGVTKFFKAANNAALEVGPTAYSADPQAILTLRSCFL